METSTLTSKSLLLIPKRLRIKYRLKAGTRIIFEEMEDGVKIIPMNREYFKSYAGILSFTGSLKEDLRKIKMEELKMENRKEKLAGIFSQTP